MPSPQRSPVRNYLFALLGLLSAWIGAPASGQVERSLRGVPNYRFFTSQDFDSGASAEFIATAANGTIFYADRNWIFLYDGATWRKIYENNESNTRITALRWDADGRTYAAGYNAFGELVIDENNQARFKALVDPSQINIQESFQKIQSSADAIYLIGRRSFARYDKKTGAIDSHTLPIWITADFWLDEKIHLLTDANEILRYENGAFVHPPEFEAELRDQGITIADIARKENGELIMASERKGLFTFDGKEIKRAYPEYKYDSSNLVRDIELTTDNRLLVASLGSGITVLNEDGITLEHIGPNIDHRFKSARSITIDKSGAAWAMFNSSAAKILLDSPLTAIDENMRPSFFYASQHLAGEDLYVRSFYILYRTVFGKNGRIKRFETVLKDPDIEVWSVLEMADDLLISTASHGIFRIVKNEPQFVIDAPAYDRLNQSKIAPEYVIGANANTIALYSKTNATLELIDQIEGQTAFINRMEEDDQGRFWLEYGLGAVGRLSLEDGKLKLDRFDPSHGLPNNRWLTIWMHEGTALFSSSQGVYAYDEPSQKFAPHPILKSKGIESELRIERAFTDPSGNLWISANNQNLIYWKQGDGSYRRDETSLREMGEPFFEFITFLENGQALIMTAFELFHFQPLANPLSQHEGFPATHIINIANSHDETTYFIDLGYSTTPPERRFTHQENNLVFSVSNPFTYSTVLPQFQHFLEGFSEGEPDLLPWSTSSSANFTNLDAGSYTFKSRTRLGNGYITPWTQYPFTLAPPFYQTPYAYALYATFLAILVLATIQVNSDRLRRQNAKLETMVACRTQEIEYKNEELKDQAAILESKNLKLAEQSAEIHANATELAAALEQLHQIQDQLVTTARIAGRAEVATNVLHSVGNALNSINVGLAKLEKQIGNSRVGNFKSIVKLIQENRHQLAHYLSADEKGKNIPDYLEQLAQALTKELESYAAEIQQIDKNIDHVRHIIATQQTHAKKVGVHQTIDLDELIETALAIALGESYESTYQIDRTGPHDLTIRSDKHLLLDILINLIKNAQESIAEAAAPTPPKLTISTQPTAPHFIQIAITDNGAGIAPAHRDKLFNHGFTTKPQGHGFGLHSCANAIKAIGGSLTLTSPGPQKGATATIKLPR